MSIASIATILLLAGSDQSLASTQSTTLPHIVDAVGSAPPGSSAPTTDETAQAIEDASLPPDDSAIVVTARSKVPEDPAQQLNLATYEVVDAADRAIIGPVSMGYKNGLPEPVRDGLHNLLTNLTEPVNFVNFLLQGKLGKAFETLGRFAINTSIGEAGLFDVAKRKPFNLPYRHNGFANSLGFYGIGQGPYFFLPLIGPTTLRDFVGWTLDKAFLPALVGPPLSKPAYAIGSGTIKSLDDRVAFNSKLEEFRDTGDAYTAERQYYLKQRKDEIEALHRQRPRIKKQKTAMNAQEAIAPPPQTN